MWAADAPTCTADETAVENAKGIKDINLRRALRSARKEISKNSLLYQQRGNSFTLHESDRSHYTVPGLTAEQLKWLYKSKLARAQGPGRKSMKTLPLRSPYGLCAYCHCSAVRPGTV